MRGLARRAFVPAALLMTVIVAPLEAQAPDSLEPVRQHYLTAVHDESAIQAGLLAIEELRGSGGAGHGSTTDAVLSAYRGALITLRAKHGFWPHARLRHLREGLAILDQAVTASPSQSEIRFLRLLSCYYLPGILGRRWSVREDFTALAHLLPAARHAYPPELYTVMVQFVMDHGALEAHERRRLEAALGAAADG